MTFLVLGAGRFGTRAVAYLKKYKPGCALVWVDQDPAVLTLPEEKGVRKLCRDGVDYLLEILKGRGGPDWIIPAIPRHVAFEVCLKVLAGELEVKRISPPGEAEKWIPHPLRGPDGALYMSFADFICPDDCPEPKDRCTVTGEFHPPLYRLLKDLKIPGFTSQVLRSLQIGPGVGGIRTETLRRQIDALRRVGKKILFSTACRCHGVMDGMELAG